MHLNSVISFTVEQISLPLTFYVLDLDFKTNSWKHAEHNNRAKCVKKENGINEDPFAGEVRLEKEFVEGEHMVNILQVS